MDIKIIKNLVPELVHMDQAIGVLKREAFLLNSAITNQNPELVDFYYKAFVEAHSEYQKASGKFIRQVNRLAVNNDISTIDREVGR